MGIIEPGARKALLEERFRAAEKKLKMACAEAVAQRKQEIKEIKLRTKEQIRKLKKAYEQDLYSGDLE